MSASPFGVVARQLLNSRESINDVRYAILASYLKEGEPEISCAFLTDAWDVHFKHNPCLVVR
jgi:hypothetical protein